MSTGLPLGFPLIVRWLENKSLPKKLVEQHLTDKALIEILVLCCHGLLDHLWVCNN